MNKAQTASIEAKLGVRIVRVKSHNASNNMSRLCPSAVELLSIKHAFSRALAADGYYALSEEDAQRLKTAHGRWTGSIIWPSRVPADLDFRHGLFA